MVSEKDARIAALEMAGAKKFKKEIDSLQLARADDLRALKEQFDKRAALIAAMNSSRDSLDRSRDHGTREDCLDKLELREAESRRLRAYIDQLLAEVLKQADNVSVSIMTGLPRLQQVRGEEEERKRKRKCI
jgi:hypothetical protein